MNILCVCKFQGRGRVEGREKERRGEMNVHSSSFNVLKLSKRKGNKKNFLDVLKFKYGE